MPLQPLDPFSEVVDERRRWTPDWYSWLKDLSKLAGTTMGGGGDIFKFTNPVMVLSGFNVGSFDSSRLYVNGGTLWSAVDNAIYSTNQNGLAYMVDLGTSGIQTWSGDPDGGGVRFVPLLGGLLDGPVVNGDPIYLVVVHNEDNLLSVVAIKQYIYDNYLNSRLPAGWTAVRFLPFAVKYVLGHGPHWNGLPNFFTDVEGGTRTLLSGTENSANYALSRRLTNATMIADRPGIPPGDIVTPARTTGDNLLVSPCLTVMIQYAVSHSGTPAGTASAYLGGGASLFQIGEVTPGQKMFGEMTFRLDTGLGFRYICTPGAIIDVFLKGWWFEDPA